MPIEDLATAIPSILSPFTKSNPSRIIQEQRSSCVLYVYKWKEPEKTKIVELGSVASTAIGGVAAAGSALDQATSILDNLQRTNPNIIDHDVIRCNISKMKNTSSGTFSITLKQGSHTTKGIPTVGTKINYLEILSPGDWIGIYLKKNGKIDIRNLNRFSADSGLKMLGIIENVRYVEVDDPDQSSPRLEFIVTGRDFGKVFERSIYFNPLLSAPEMSTLLGVNFLKNSNKQVRSNQVKKVTLLTNTPDFVIRQLIDFYLGGSLDIQNASHQVWFIPETLAEGFIESGIINPTEFSIKGVNAFPFVSFLDTTRMGVHIYSTSANAVTSASIFDIPSVFIAATPCPGTTTILALPPSGTAWSIMETFRNPHFNEMYPELVFDPALNSLKPSLIMRQIPFSNRKNPKAVAAATLNKARATVIAVNPDLTSRIPPATFGTTSPYDMSLISGVPALDTVPDVPGLKTFYTDLPRYDILSTDVKEKNVGKSDHERINHIVVSPSLLVDSQALEHAYSSTVNSVSIQRYGLRSYLAETSYVRDLKIGGVFGLQYFSSLLTDWYFLAHKYYNGTLVLDGFDKHLELGMNIFLRDVSQLYHVEGYTHRYEITSDGRTIYNTEVTVSRGMLWNPKTNETDFIDSDYVVDPVSVKGTSVLEGIRG